MMRPQGKVKGISNYRLMKIIKQRAKVKRG